MNAGLSLSSLRTQDPYALTQLGVEASDNIFSLARWLWVPARAHRALGRDDEASCQRRIFRLVSETASFAAFAKSIVTSAEMSAKL